MINLGDGMVALIDPESVEGLVSIRWAPLVARNGWVGVFSFFFANPVTSRMETTKETMNPPPTARGQPIETTKQLQK
jgi:hypothetical protein